MSASDDHLGSGIGPDLALSGEERERVEAIVGAIRDVPTVDEEEVLDRYLDTHRTAAFWSDEFDTAPQSELLKYRPPPLGLPGFGDAYDDCGAKIPHVCSNPDCGATVEIGRTCARSRCPRCGAAWVVKRAPKLVARIHESAAMKSAAMDDGTPVFKHHGIISPPDDWLADVDDPEEALYEIGHDIMDAIDMDGIMVYHPYRGDHEQDVDDLEAEVSAHQDDRGEWKDRIFSNRSWESVRNELKHSPHLHIIGSCEWFPGGDVTSTVHSETGWIIHRITERNGSPVSLGNLSSVARAVTYAVSHVGIDTSGERNRSAYRRHGSAFHNADLRSLDKAKEAVHHVAPDTLGVPSMEVECRNEVEDEDDVDDEHLDDEDGDEGDLEDEPDDEESSTRTCRGDLVDMDDADELLEDDEWTRSVPDRNLEKVRETYELWQEVGGWQGWIDREQSRFDVDDPPPD